MTILLILLKILKKDSHCTMTSPYKSLFRFERQQGRGSQRGAHYEEPRFPRKVQGLLPHKYLRHARGLPPSPFPHQRPLVLYSFVKKRGPTGRPGEM